MPGALRDRLTGAAIAKGARACILLGRTLHHHILPGGAGGGAGIRGRSTRASRINGLRGERDSIKKLKRQVATSRKAKNQEIEKRPMRRDLKIIRWMHMNFIHQFEGAHMRVMSVVGTRPEAIKMAPVIKALQAHPKMNSVLCLTAQHREMLDQVLQIFAIEADFDLDLMQPSQTLNGLASRIFQSVDELLASAKPDVVLVHGDTTTAFVTSVACFHRNIPVGHVEAGLRTYDLSRPFPEEMNRRIVDLVSTYLFAPTERAKQNLLAEGVMSDEIHVTGNTIVDSLRFMIAKIDGDSELQLRLAERIPALPSGRKLVLVTGHRRESFGPGFERICQALRRIGERGDVELVYPLHLNPNVSKPVNNILGRARRVHLIPPVDYMTFVHLLSRAAVVITDSGGVQEEAVSLGKRVLVMRELTERPEGIEAGLAHLVGTDPNLICSKFAQIISDESSRETNQSVYGDGNAAPRIVAALAKSQGLLTRSAERTRSNVHGFAELAPTG